MYNFHFNNNSTDNLGIGIVKRPTVPVPTKNVKATAILGGDGSSYNYLGGYSDISITVELNILELTNIKESYRQIKNWLINYTDNKLIFSDDPNWCYKVKNVTLSDFTTTSKVLGTFQVVFICDAYMYLLQSLEFETITNNYNVPNSYAETYPIFHLFGDGVVELFVNQEKMVFNITNGEVYVDCEQEIVYDKIGDCQNLSGGNFITIPNGGATITYSGNVSEIQVRANRRSL